MTDMETQKKQLEELGAVDLKKVVRAAVTAFMVNVTETAQDAIKNKREMVESAASTSGLETTAVGGMAMAMLDMLMTDEDFAGFITEMVATVLKDNGAKLTSTPNEDQTYVRGNISADNNMYF